MKARLFRGDRGAARRRLRALENLLATLVDHDWQMEHGSVRYSVHAAVIRRAKRLLSRRTP